MNTFTVNLSAFCAVLLLVVMSWAGGVHAAGNSPRLAEAARLYQVGRDTARTDPAAAEKAFTEVLAIRVEELDPHDELIGDAYHAAAVLQPKLGKHAEAEKNFRAALAVYDDAPVPNPWKIVGVLSNFATFLVDHGRYHEAVPLVLRSIDLQRANPTQFISNGRSYRALGALYMELGEYGNAREALKTYVEIAQGRMPPDEKEITEARELLAEANDSPALDRETLVMAAAFLAGFLLVVTVLTVLSLLTIWLQTFKAAPLSQLARGLAGGVAFVYVFYGLGLGSTVGYAFTHELFGGDSLYAYGVGGAGAVTSAYLASLWMQVAANLGRRLCGEPRLPVDWTIGLARKAKGESGP